MNKFSLFMGLLYTSIGIKYFIVENEIFFEFKKFSKLVMGHFKPLHSLDVYMSHVTALVIGLVIILV